jgi:phospholipid/cholesterol/gamma-HCH transport system substrate-binding protein
VKMPYNLMQTLADTVKLTDTVDPKPVRQTLDQLQQGFSGDNIQALSSIIDSGNAIMSTLDRQRGQVTQILNFSDEYIQALNGFSGELRSIVQRLAIITQVLVLYGENFGNGLKAFANILDALAPIAYFYDNHRAKFLEKVRVWMKKAQDWSQTNGSVLRTLRAIRNKIERVLDAQNASPDFLATDMCIPVPGSAC